MTLGPYGFFWFLLRESDASIEVPRTWAEFETLVVTDGWRSLLRGRSQSVLERYVLPAFPYFFIAISQVLLVGCLTPSK